MWYFVTPMAQHLNRWERHQNLKAKTKKEKAKARHFGEDRGPETGWGLSESREGVRIGIVVGIRQKFFTVMDEDIYFECVLAPGIPPVLGKQLVVGDCVVYEQANENRGTILHRQERESVIGRMRGDSKRFSDASLEHHVIVANVDRAVIVAAAQDPTFHPRFIDRYLVVLQNGGVEPVICLNKSDLTEERHPVLQSYRELGIPIIETSVMTGQGLEHLKEVIRGRIVVLVGNSGVGKSSLINAILPDADIRVNEVSQKGGRGRHTTSSTNLYKWDDKSYIIDTPGIRSLGIENIDKRSLRYFFPEFEQPMERCKFRDCLHDHEPQCAVKEAVEQGEINKHRYESYLRMLHE